MFDLCLSVYVRGCVGACVYVCFCIVRFFSPDFFSGFSMRAGQSRANTQSIDLIGILVQTDLSNENSTQIMDQIYNFLVHPIVREA